MIRLQLFQPLFDALVGVEQLHLSIADASQLLPNSVDISIRPLDFLTYLFTTLVDEIFQLAHPGNNGSKATLSLLVKLVFESLKSLLQKLNLLSGR
ncbi:hypothetical protein SGCOL_009304 [Colletotrichum sp. CLE4]